MTINRAGIEISYTWLSMIDIGLKSFFDQCNLWMQGKPTDWRFCTEFLSMKFEGILRDIIALNGGTITKIDDKGNTVSFLLDDLLRSKEAFYKTFDDDDLNLFNYAFSSKPNCLNIRNNIAHSFYKPQDYSYYKALTAFICILRLAKYSPKSNY